MHSGEKFGYSEVLMWTRREIFIFIIIASIPTVLFEVVGLEWLMIPWLPIALVGTAVAFLVGFKNNATYDRLWEARKIYGGIVNSSRTWGIMARDFVSNHQKNEEASDGELNAIRKRLIYRHIGWLTALRYQLRQPRTWESMSKPEMKEYRKKFHVEEVDKAMDEDLKEFLSEKEFGSIIKMKNPATQIIAAQSSDLKHLMEKGHIEDFRHMEMENLLATLYDLQGKCERIKNFPYPRQFATINHIFVWLFILLVPFGMLQVFDAAGELFESGKEIFHWLTIPFSVLVSWVFHTMEKIGSATANPFEGSANDVPITALSRTIEIDLREMLGETDLPEPKKAVKKILM